MLCSADESCMDSFINCPLSGACHIECRGDKACRDAVVNASASVGDFSLDCLDSTDHCKRMRVLGSTLSTNTGDFRVTCDGKLRSCANSHIECPLHGDCALDCAADTSCRWTDIIGPSQGALAVHCAGELSCFDAVINAANATALTVSGCTAYESCFDLTVYCSNSAVTNGSANCFLAGNDNLGQDNGGGTVIYAVNGWQDVELTYSGTFGPSHHGRMFCGAQYEQSCELASDDWACADDHNKCNGRNHSTQIHLVEVNHISDDHTDDHADDHADDDHDSDHSDDHGDDHHDDDHHDDHDDHADYPNAATSWPLTTRIAFAVGVVALIMTVSSYCYCSRKLGHRFEQQGVPTPKSAKDTPRVVVYADGHYEYPHAEHSRSHHSRSRHHSRSHRRQHQHAHSHGHGSKVHSHHHKAAADRDPIERVEHVAHLSRSSRHGITPQPRDVHFAQIYGHQSMAHHTTAHAAHHNDSARGSRPTSAHTYSKTSGQLALFASDQKSTPSKFGVASRHQSSKSHDRDHFLTKGDTLRSQDTLRSGGGSGTYRRSHNSSAIHTPDVHDHSAMELDGTLTRSPSRTGDDGSGVENSEPQRGSLGHQRGSLGHQRQREIALRDVSRVLSLTQHAPEAKLSTHVNNRDARSHVKGGSEMHHAPVLSLTHNGPHSPPFEPALPLQNADSNQTNLTNATMTSVDVMSVQGLLKMPPMVAQRTSANSHWKHGHTPNVSMDSALSRITDLSTIVRIGGGGGHKESAGRVQYRAVEHREESESESESESDERQRRGRRRGASLARQRAVTLSVHTE